MNKQVNFLGDYTTPADRLNEYLSTYNFPFKHFVIAENKYIAGKHKTKIYCTKCRRIHELDRYYWKCPVCDNKEAYDIHLCSRKKAKFILDIIFLIDVIDENRFNIIRIDREVDATGLINNTIEDNIFIRGYVSYDYEKEFAYAYIRKKNGNFRRTRKLIDLLTPKSKEFANVAIVGAENFSKCSNFYLKTGYKELEKFVNYNHCSWAAEREIQSILNYIDYNKNNKNNQVELLIKAGYDNLVEEIFYHGNYEMSAILNRKGTKIKDLIRLPKNALKIIKKYKDNVHEKTILQLEKIYEKDKNISCEFLEFLLNDQTNTNTSLNQIINIIDFGFSTKEIYNYLIKADLYQAIDYEETLQLWRDYLSMCKMMDVPFIRFPDSLKKEHDLMARNFKYQEDEIIEKEFRKRAHELSYLEYQSSKYMIVVPKETKEVVREGKVLRHCVASYIRGIALGKTTVLFIRRKEAPKEPFYTLEVKDGQIIQIKGFANVGASKEIKKFVAEWKKEKLDKYKRLSA